MWKLALVQGPNATIFEANGTRRESYGEFQKAVSAMLQQGWEPFGADSSNLVVVWFRMKA